MLPLTDGPSVRPMPRTLAVVALGAAVAWLVLALGAAADGSAGRRPGEPIVERLSISGGERAAIRGRAEAIAAGLGLAGRAAEPSRLYHAVDLRIVDETDITDAAGRTLAVVRTEAESGAVRSVVNLGWTRDALTPRVELDSAAGAARGLARSAGLTAPSDEPDVRWDDAMGAWRVAWQRRIAGYPALGDGLTLWVHRGGQLSALSRSETPAAAMPLALIEAGRAAEAARAWVASHRLPEDGLSLTVRDVPVWVRPNDFVRRGGADDTDRVLRLAYRVDIVMPIESGGRHHIALFVDAGSGLVIAGAESA